MKKFFYLLPILATIFVSCKNEDPVLIQTYTDALITRAECTTGDASGMIIAAATDVKMELNFTSKKSVVTLTGVQLPTPDGGKTPAFDMVISDLPLGVTNGGNSNNPQGYGGTIKTPITPTLSANAPISAPSIVGMTYLVHENETSCIINLATSTGSYIITGSPQTLNFPYNTVESFMGPSDVPSFTSESAIVKVVFNVEKMTATMTLNNIQFADKMPPLTNMQFRDIPFTVKSSGIVVESAQFDPYLGDAINDKYNITNFRFSFAGSEGFTSFTCMGAFSAQIVSKFHKDSSAADE